MTGCDTGNSTWGYCSDDFSSWYHEDAVQSDWGTYVGGGVCPGGSVSVFNFDEWPGPPEPTYFYVGPVRFEVAPATPA